MSKPLCVLVPETGVVSETFIAWDVRELLPGGTVVVTDPPPKGATILGAPAWHVGPSPVLAFRPANGDPAPSPERQRAAIRFLAEHHVEAVLVEYLDFADRWFDLLINQGLRVWLRGHGQDFSARLREPHWRQRYRRYARADGIIVPSHAAQRALVDVGLPEQRVHVVRYCVELPPEPIGEGRATPGSVRCVAVGRLVPKKAPLLLLESFRLAAARCPMLRLDVVGDGPLMPDVCTFLAHYGLAGHVTLRGALPHDRALTVLRAADLLTHHAVTSPIDGDCEGTPLAILEAMAAGLPVVATRHAGIPEVVTDGVSGLLVDEGDTAGMAEAITRLARDRRLRAQFGAAGRKVATCDFTSEHARRRLLGLLGLTHGGIR